MGGGGGDSGDNFLSNPIGAIDNFGKSIVKDPLGTGAEISTLGYYDRKKGGVNLKNYQIFKMFDETIGELTGRNASRYANRQQQKAIDAEKVARAREADLLWLDRYRQDLASSYQASAFRSTAASKPAPSNGNKLGGTGEDLLGV